MTRSKASVTPALGHQPDPIVNSTPIAKGTASRAALTTDSRANSPENILLVEEDLKGKRTVRIVHLLQALLARILLERDGNVLGEDPLYHKQIIDERNSIFKEILEDVVLFCNKKEGESWDNLERHLKDFCSQSSETGRYLPLSHALNTIMMEFGRKKYGSLQKPDSGEDEETVIFMPNDPNVIESKHLWEKSKRKPDVIGVPLSSFHDIYEDFKDLNYKQISTKISKETRKKLKPSRDISWSDVYLTLELKMENKKLEFPNRKWSTKTLMKPKKQQSTVTGLKRTHDDCGPVDNDLVPKKPRCNATVTQNVHISIVPEGTPSEPSQPKINPRTQCAYYGIERLSSAWTVMHSFVALLEDQFLSLCWYDAQGAIESEPLDIIKELPIFVMMVVIFQRFNLYMWGVSQRDDTKVDVDGQSFCLDHVPTPFQLSGRRTTGTFADFRSHLTGVNEGEDIAHNTRKLPRRRKKKRLFFKSSWKEISREKEYEIIKVGRERIRRLLPKAYRPMVANHIPNVIASQECTSESTAVIRFLLDEAEGHAPAGGKINQKGARVQIWMIMPKLKPAHDLEPEEFWRVYWDIMRCHYLLWRIGVAHGDISLTNLMCTKRKGKLVGILNDFDLASIMDPGARCPKKTGWERTGSLPFMAIDLLNFPDGGLKRWYRHDLESFLFCLIWEMLNDPPTSWIHKGITAVAGEKNLFFHNIDQRMQDFKPKWEMSIPFITGWVDDLQEYSHKVRKGVTSYIYSKKAIWASVREKVEARNAEEEKTLDSAHIREVAQSAVGVLSTSSVPALLDISWIDVVLESSKSQ